MRIERILLLTLALRSAGAQASDTTHHAPGTTVGGIVYDSIARAPLAGAVVQLVPPDSLARLSRVAMTDSTGRYLLTDVADGHYVIGFMHATVDSLGVELPVHELFVEHGRPERVDLAIPSPARLRAAVCGTRPGADAGGLVLGSVRAARDGATIAGATVRAEWLEVTFSATGITRNVPRPVATTAANGWFAMCGVPVGGSMYLRANRGADSTDRIEVRVPASGFVRRELYVGAARTAPANSAPRADTLAPPPPRLRTGDGRLRGTVVAVEGSRPLAGAQVRIADGPLTRANERGEFTLDHAPTGTRNLEVRAIGFYPDFRAVDVVADGTPVRVALSTFSAMLDTVKVTAARVADRLNSGFQERRRTGQGRYLSADDIAKRGAVVVSDLFRNFPGVRLQRDAGSANTEILMRSISTDWCKPAIYVDGLYMAQFNADDIDSFLTPEHLMGVEVYTETTAPVQFQQGMTGCGSIVIWKK
ncbi:MAG: carboxypeptidase regulatory-like domain-containing protein [Gemmatimonadetes bacterium]|nr:carboxypeptidase regulatory-like domain-containing protein [Gemmatimonadota bacterium]